MKSLNQCLRYWVDREPNAVKFVSLEGDKKTYTNKEVLEQVCAKVNQLNDYKEHESILLIYDNTIDFITSFLACQYIGVIPIPMFYPKNIRHYDRLKVIVDSSDTRLILCAENDQVKIQKGVRNFSESIQVISLKDSPFNGIDVLAPEVKSPISFIQYTSGSTAAPKGVVVSHENVMYNQKMIQEVFGCDENSTILSWLPFYHDMGLIGNLLHAIYTGAKCVVLKPATVVSSPRLWLKAIEEYKVTHSGGPNFIYDLCAEKIVESEINNLDLSTWKVAYNGAEPLKSSTVKRFVETFANTGFSLSNFYSCYGLAEATLIVSGGPVKFYDHEVGSGPVVSEIDVIFYDEASNSFSKEAGEICLAGESITAGYWKIQDDQYFVSFEGRRFLRTGDSGKYIEGELLIDGRLKEMLILNGVNIFPYDLEELISSEIQPICKNGVALFGDSDALYVAAEIKRSELNAQSTAYQTLRKRINNILIENAGVSATKVFFVLERALPRTSSGKIKRAQIHQLITDGDLAEIKGSELYTEISEFDLEEFEWTNQGVRNYLIELIENKLNITEEVNYSTTSLFELGLSSLKGVEIINQINADLELDVEFEKLFELNNLDKITEYLLDIKWLNSDIEGEEIIL